MLPVVWQQLIVLLEILKEMAGHFVLVVVDGSFPVDRDHLTRLPEWNSYAMSFDCMQSF
jgi:hypothetical protein